eukprot:2177990-Amphidinium_carterae.1
MLQVTIPTIADALFFFDCLQKGSPPARLHQLRVPDTAVPRHSKSPPNRTCKVQCGPRCCELCDA